MKPRVHICRHKWAFMSPKYTSMLPVSSRTNIISIWRNTIEMTCRNCKSELTRFVVSSLPVTTYCALNGGGHLIKSTRSKTTTVASTVVTYVVSGDTRILLVSLPGLWPHWRSVCFLSSSFEDLLQTIRSGVLLTIVLYPRSSKWLRKWGNKRQNQQW